MKKIFMLTILNLIMYSTIFGQSSEFTTHIDKAKEYETQKKWCYALAEYYDALGTDDSEEIKDKALEAYNTLAASIENGNPGLGTYNDFTLHDEWKNLLIDSEKYGSTHSKYELWIGDLQKGDLDYTNKTATYYSQIIPTVSYKWLKTIGVIVKGYEKAYKSDWTDLPRASYNENDISYTYSDWPKESVSSKKDKNYNVNGALIYRIDSYRGTEFYNAFEYLGKKDSLHDFKFNIIDENGNELVKGKRWLLGTDNNTISFSGITPSIMDLIDNDKARINLVAEYLEYGIYNSNDDNGGRSFIKNFPEKEISFDQNFVHYDNVPNEDKTKKYLIQKKLGFYENNALSLVVSEDIIPYDLPEIVMGGSHKMDTTGTDKYKYYSFSKGNSAIDDLIFVIRLSQIFGYKPVYSVNNLTSIYINYSYYSDICFYEFGNPLYGGNVEINEDNSGFRLATKEETENFLYDDNLKFGKHVQEWKSNLPYDWSNYWSLRETVEYYITSYHETYSEIKEDESASGGSYQFIIVRNK